MAWWRRDPSLWCRSPIHRYSQRILRDHEAVLRSRSFSKSQACAAQHKHDDDAKRPDGLTDLEWLQLQHYRRWKRRLQDDPYRALFGASNDMLSGKGLKDWTWVYKTFPKWMLKEMDLPKYPEKPKSKGSTEADMTASESERPMYPRRVEIVDEGLNKAESSYRTSQFEHPSHSAGIQSPSDLRRPRDLGTSDNRSGRQEVNSGHSLDYTSHSGKAAEIHRASEQGQQRTLATAAEDEGVPDIQKDTESRESTFIKEFLAATDDWKQTALDRRAGLEMTPTPKKERLFASEGVNAGSSARAALDIAPTPKKERLSAFDGVNAGLTARDEQPPSLIPPSQSSEGPGDNVQFRSPPNTSSQSTGSSNVAWIQGVSAGAPYALANSIFSKDSSAGGTAAPSKPRSTKDVLEQLPENDLDFLSPEEIRASMGVKKSDKESAEEKQKARAKLEEAFADAQSDTHELDPVLRGQVIGNQYMRRTTRELKTAASKNSDTSTNNAASQGPIETSMDRMTRWLQTGGDTFAKHFWSDPVHVKEAQMAEKRSPDPQLKALISGIQASRRTMAQVYDSLPTDLPASAQLLERLKSNKSSTVTAIGSVLRLRHDTRPIESRGNSVDKVGKIRDALTKTQDEFDTACKALEASVESNDRTKLQTMSEATKSRLRNSSLILEKNAKLTRRMIYSMQARLEHALTRGHDTGRPLPPYREFGHHLLALQDTQLALLRLVERSLQIYGIDRKPLVAQEPNSQGQETIVASTTSDNSKNVPSPAEDEAMVLSRKLAAQQKLENEIQAQKSAMRGLSDDGYARVPKPQPKTTFDESNPLAHSLFRPFSLQLEGLGKDTKNAEGITTENQFHQALKDRALVRDIKKSYEDVYGPITVHHRQVEQQDETEADNAKKKGAESETNVENLTTQTVETNSVDSEIAVPTATDVKESASTELVAESPATTEPSETDTVVSDVRSSVAPAKSSDGFLPASTELLHQNVLKTAAAIAAMSTEQTSSAARAIEDPQKEPPSSSSVPESNESASSEVVAPPEPIAALAQEAVAEKSTYYVLTYDPSAAEMSIVTSSSATSSAALSPVPIHEALAILDAPAKFLPHLPDNFEIITAKPNLLVLRTSPGNTWTVLPRSILTDEQGVRDEDCNRVNPVDGTTRLSPTGFVGVEPDFRDESQESSVDKGIRTKDSNKMAEEERRLEEEGRQLHHEMREFNMMMVKRVSNKECIPKEDYDKADGILRKVVHWEKEPGNDERPWSQEINHERFGMQRIMDEKLQLERHEMIELNNGSKDKWRQEKGNKKGGVASVFKTAIVASALCYVAGVLGEILR